MIFYPKTILSRMVAIFTLGTLTVGIVATFAIYSLNIATRESAKRERIASSIAWAIESVDQTNQLWQLQRLLRLINRPGFKVEISSDPLVSVYRDQNRQYLADAYAGQIQQHLEYSYKLSASLATINTNQFASEKRRARKKLPITLERSHPIELLSVTVQLQNGYWLLLEMPVPKSSYSLPWQTLMVLFVVVMTVILLSIIAVRFSTRPLRMLAVAARKLGENIYSPPIPEQGMLEVQYSARAFNQMQAQIQSLIKEKADFLAAISHDLKTPLTRMRIRCEMIDSTKLQQQFQTDIDEMNSMIQAALDYIRNVSKDEAVSCVDLHCLLQSLTDDHNLEHEQVVLLNAESIHLQARPMALKRCFNNLIDNALHYGSKLQIRYAREQQFCLIELQDNGPGIPEDKMEAVFQPFFRADSSRNLNHQNHGLGLAIVKNIIDAHDGEVSLKNTKQGLLVQIKLPVV